MIKLSFTASVLLALGSSKTNTFNLQQDITTITGGTGTIFLNGNWITSRIRHKNLSVTPKGACERTMYDRRTDLFATT